MQMIKTQFICLHKIMKNCLYCTQLPLLSICRHACRCRYHNWMSKFKFLNREGFVWFYLYYIIYRQIVSLTKLPSYSHWFVLYIFCVAISSNRLLIVSERVDISALVLHKKCFKKSIRLRLYFGYNRDVTNIWF